MSRVIERVIVDDDGQVSLELRTPFGYLSTLANEVKREKRRSDKTVKRGHEATKNGEGISPPFPPNNVRV